MEILWACESPFSHFAEEPVGCKKVINMHKEKRGEYKYMGVFDATSRYSKFSDISECFLVHLIADGL